MAIDPNIIAGIRPVQIESPMNALAQMLRVQGMAQDAQLGQAKLDEYTRGKDRQNKLLGLVQSLPGDTTDDGRIKALRGGGYFDEADKIEKGIGERRKIESEAGEREWKVKKDKLAMAGNAFGGVMKNPTLENALGTLDYIGQNDLMPMELVERYRSGAKADPSKIGAFAEQAFRSILDADKQLDEIKTNNLGGTTQTLGIDPVTGKATVLSTAKNTQSPDSVASVAATMRGQNMVDSRQREANANSRGLMNEERQLRIEALRGKAEDRKLTKDGTAASLRAQIGVIDKALDHPGRAASTGLSGSLDPRNYVPGTDATDFRVVADQLGGGAFLQAFESLKGAGQITEIEGQKATQAIARLNRAQSDSEYETALHDLRDVINGGLVRSGAMPAPARPRAGAAPAPAKSGVKFLGFE